MAIALVCNIWKVEHGSAALLVTPNGRRVMFDAGSSSNFSPANHIKDYGFSGNLDALVISHQHDDHLTDLPNVLSMLKPASIWRNPYTPRDLIFPKGMSSLQCPMDSYAEMDLLYNGTVSAGTELNNVEYYGGVSINTFCVGESHLPDRAKNNLNNYSLVSTVQYDGLLVVFPGDLEPDGWDAVIDNTDFTKHLDGNIRILVAPHHGRSSGIRLPDGSVHKRVLECIRPSLAIISDKYGNDTTDPEAYRPYCSGLKVVEGSVVTNRAVLTTKTNNCVSIQAEEGGVFVKVY